MTTRDDNTIDNTKIRMRRQYTIKEDDPVQGPPINQDTGHLRSCDQFIHFLNLDTFKVSKGMDPEK